MNQMSMKQTLCIVASVLVVLGLMFVVMTLMKPVEKANVSSGDQINIWENEFASRHNHEPETNALLRRLAVKLPRDSLIVDAGAHVGDTGIRLAKFLKDKAGRQDLRVLEIDPDETKVSFIRRKAAKWDVNSMILTETCGLYKSDTRGTVVKKTLDGEEAVAGSRGSGQWQIVEDPTGGDVVLHTLDSIMVPLHHEVKLIHLDVEGGELAALEGAEKTIVKDKPYIVIEVSNDHDDKVHKQLVSYGYKKEGERLDRDQLYVPI